MAGLNADGTSLSMPLDGSASSSKRGKKRKGSEAGLPTSTSAKRFLEGFGDGGRGYLNVSPRVASLTKVLQPSNSSNYATDRIINFDIEAGHDELIRFEEGAFTIQYKLLRENEAAPDPTQRDHRRLAYYLVKPLENDEPPVFVSQLLAGESFVSNISLVCDGTNMPASAPGDDLWIYSSLNRRFSTSGARRNRFGYDLTWCANSIEERYTSTGRTPETRMAPELLREVKQHYDPDADRSPDAAPADIVHFSPHGVFPFSHQNLTLRALTGERKNSGWLHPGFKMNVKLSLRENLACLLQRADHSTEQKFDNAVINAADHPRHRVQIVGISLSYSSCKLASASEVAAVNASRHDYVCDVPLMLSVSLPSGRMEDVQTLDIPADTVLVYLFWMHQSQYLISREGQAMHARFRFPPHLALVEIDFAGHTSQLFKNGLLNPGIPGRNFYSPSMRLYHNYLTRNNLYSRDFQSWCPRQAGEYGFDQVLILDLTPFKRPDFGKLRVRMVYSQASTELMQLRAVCVKQVQYSHTSATGWSARYI